MPDIMSPVPTRADRQGPVLITSFRPWRTHQRSNSSDDLLTEVHRQLPTDVVWLPQVPVSFQLAPIRVINELYRLRPRLVICCGMAEKRSVLSLEQQAKRGENVLTTSFCLAPLLAGTTHSEISYDAGSYVCNHLYYSVLDFLIHSDLMTAGLFIHVPILHSKNKKQVVADFLHIYSQLTQKLGYF